jgi:hypothetical protein
MAGQPNALGFASRILGGKALTMDAPAQQDTTQMPDTSKGLLDDSSDMTPTAQADTSPFAPANIQNSVNSILSQGGTMKDVQEFLANAKAINDLTAAQSSAGGTGKPLSATAADALANAKAGIDSLGIIRQQLAKDPGVQQRQAVPQIANPFGIASRLAGTGEYDAAVQQAKDVVARLRTGAAISSSEEKRFTAMLPQPADDPATVDQKLTTLENALHSVYSRVGGNSADILQEAATAAQ